MHTQMEIGRKGRVLAGAAVAVVVAAALVIALLGSRLLVQPALSPAHTAATPASVITNTPEKVLVARFFTLINAHDYDSTAYLFAPGATAALYPADSPKEIRILNTHQDAVQFATAFVEQDPTCGSPLWQLELLYQYGEMVDFYVQVTSGPCAGNRGHGTMQVKQGKIVDMH